jgi:hypothetical protein
MAGIKTTGYVEQATAGVEQAAEPTPEPKPEPKPVKKRAPKKPKPPAGE